MAEKPPNVNPESFSSQQPRGEGGRSGKESGERSKGAGPD